MASSECVNGNRWRSLPKLICSAVLRITSTGRKARRTSSEPPTAAMITSTGKPNNRVTISLCRAVSTGVIAVPISSTYPRPAMEVARPTSRMCCSCLSLRRRSLGWFV